ncbi:MAG: DinB family protein [Ferruginibacter sp.]
MKRSDINPLPKHFDTYINKTEDIELNEALKKSLANLKNLPVDKWIALGDQVYAPGKWTVKDILQHIIDAERIFSYRALRFARKDTTKLPGFEENDYAAVAEANHRSLTELMNELVTVRQSTVEMFAAFNDEVQQRMGSTTSAEISVAAIGFTIVGHEIHHLRILEERYYPLLS